MALERRKATEGRQSSLGSAEVKIRDSKIQGLALPSQDHQFLSAVPPGRSSFILYSLSYILPLFSFQKTAQVYSVHFVHLELYSLCRIYSIILAKAFESTSCGSFNRFVRRSVHKETVLERSSGFAFIHRIVTHSS
jgi:hypothetical protein